MFGALLSVTLAYAADGYLTSQVGDQVRSRHTASGRTVVVVVDSANDVGTFEHTIGAASWLTVRALMPGGVEATRAAAGAECALHVTRAGAGNFWAIAESGTCTAPPVAAVAPPAVPVAPATVVAATAAPDLVTQLMALKDNAARKARLVAMLTDSTVNPGVASRLGEAIAVVSSLDAAKRTDATVVRLFLRAALDPDPVVRQAAVAAARANGDPPLGGASTNASVAPIPGAPLPAPVNAPVVTVAANPPDPARLREYKQQHLVRGEITFTSGSYSASHGTGFGYVATTHTWAVRDGGGAPYKSIGFASTVGDTGTVSRMQKQRKTATTEAVVLGVVGVGMLTAGFATLDVDSESLGAPLTLLTLGTFAASFSVLPPVIYSTRNNMIGRVYTTVEADRWIERYNGALRARLGLSEADVQGIDLAP